MVKEEAMDLLAIKWDLSYLCTYITAEHSSRELLPKLLESFFPRSNNLLKSGHQLCFAIPPVRNGVVVSEPRQQWLAYMTIQLSHSVSQGSRAVSRVPLFRSPG